MTEKKIQKTEHVIDATGRAIGRVASEVATLLQGKTHANYLPRLAGGDSVTVKNASKVKINGQKLIQKTYYHHTGYRGHLKEESLQQVMEKNPTEAVRRAVFNMLPKNWLRQKRMNRLKIEA